MAKSRRNGMNPPKGARSNLPDTLLPEMIRCQDCKKPKIKTFYSPRALDDLKMAINDNSRAALPTATVVVCRACAPKNQLDEFTCIDCRWVLARKCFTDAKIRQRDGDEAQCKACALKEQNGEYTDEDEANDDGSQGEWDDHDDNAGTTLASTLGTTSINDYSTYGDGGVSVVGSSVSSSRAPSTTAQSAINSRSTTGVTRYDSHRTPNDDQGGWAVTKDQRPSSEFGASGFAKVRAVPKKVNDNVQARRVMEEIKRLQQEGPGVQSSDDDDDED